MNSSATAVFSMARENGLVERSVAVVMNAGNASGAKASKARPAATALNTRGWRASALAAMNASRQIVTKTGSAIKTSANSSVAAK
jgi:hypothetical protein